MSNEQEQKNPLKPKIEVKIPEIYKDEIKKVLDSLSEDQKQSFIDNKYQITLDEAQALDLTRIMGGNASLGIIYKMNEEIGAINQGLGKSINRIEDNIEQIGIKSNDFDAKIAELEAGIIPTIGI